MPYFIDRLAEYINENDLDLRHLTIILPSQRAKKYLQRALYKVYHRPIFSPTIITMNHWVQELSPQPIINPTRALFKLYEVHRKVDTEEPQTIDEFLKWGKILLNDFDELDRYLIDSKDLFKNLQDIKEIENWSFNSEEKLTEGQERFMRFWDLLKNYYHTFNDLLTEEGSTYMGKAYRHLATNIHLAFEKDKKQTFIFAGFNALSPAEIAIMKQLQKMDRAKIFVDGDDYYVKDKNHEAGRFIRHLLDELQVNSLPFIEDKIQNDTKTIVVTNCPQTTGQVKVSASILAKIPPEEYSKTLLLLADEKLVVPVMKNIPGEIENANITLGLPLKNTALRSWVDLFFNVQEHFNYFKTHSLYHKDLIRFVKHPFIVEYCTADEKKALARLEKDIVSNNLMFINKDKIKAGPRLRQLIGLFFAPFKQPYSLLSIQTVNRLLFEGLSNEKSAIERSIIYHFDHALQALNPLLEEFQPLLKDCSLSTFKMLFNQHWSRENISYFGNPLDGLQVMGLLETRLIDFENIIVVGLNEGSMPPTNPIQTLIPMDLRRYHNLPTPREKQGLFAHHFYRLLHHAKKCWITYSSANQPIGGVDEPSRYILQLELELAAAHPNIHFVKQDYAIKNTKENTAPVTVPKDEPLLHRMDDYFAHRTSASALKTAMNCPLDFYYKYLLGIGEEEKVEEDIEASTFGSLIHNTLESFYKPFVKAGPEGKTKPVTALHIEEMLGLLKERIRQAYDRHFTTHALEGRNYLSLEMAEHLTRRYLRQEKKQLKEAHSHLFILGTEVKVDKKLSLSINGEEKIIQFTGFIDRIDEKDGEKRIIDYKTGKCDAKEVTLSLPKKQLANDKVVGLVNVLKRKKYMTQLLIYNMLFYEKYSYYPNKTGIISFVNIKDSPFYLTNNLTDSMDELMVLFEKALVKIIEELYTADLPFEHNKKSEFCDYCEV